MENKSQPININFDRAVKIATKMDDELYPFDIAVNKAYKRTTKWQMYIGFVFNIISIAFEIFKKGWWIYCIFISCHYDLFTAVFKQIENIMSTFVDILKAHNNLNLNFIALLIAIVIIVIAILGIKLGIVISKDHISIKTDNIKK